jgi:hypothetical protein
VAFGAEPGIPLDELAAMQARLFVCGHNNASDLFFLLTFSF